MVSESATDPVEALFDRSHWGLRPSRRDRAVVPRAATSMAGTRLFFLEK